MKNIFRMDSPFAGLMNLLASVLFVGLLWLICSIPVITFGAASCAAYDTTVNVIRKRRGYVASYFFDSFKDNFLISLKVQIVAIVILGILGFDSIYLYGYGTDFSVTLSYILYGIIALFLLIITYIYPVMQRFDESFFELFKLSFYITFRYIFTSVSIVIMLAIMSLCIYLMPWSIVVIPGLWIFIKSIIIERIIRKFSTVLVEEEETFEEEPDNRNKKSAKTRKGSNRKGESLISIEPGENSRRKTRQDKTESDEDDVDKIVRKE